MAGLIKERPLNKIIAIALLLATSAAFPIVTPVLADSSSSALCGPDAPEGYKRPGGYCEELDQGSLMKSDDDCRYIVESMLTTLKAGETILVAANCHYDVVKL